jgi:hypothetical protein
LKLDFGETFQGKVEELHLFNKSKWIEVPEKGVGKSLFDELIGILYAFVMRHVVASLPAALSF